MRHLARLVLVALALLAPAAARAGDPPGEVVETWDRLHVGGAPAGFVRTTVRRVGGEAPRVESTLHTELKLGRMGQAIEIVTTTETWETPGGAPLRIATTSKMSSQETRVVCTFAEGKVTIESTVMGKSRSVVKEVPAGIVGPIFSEVAQQGLAGTTDSTAEFTTYLADMQMAVQTTLTSKGPEKVKLPDGSTVELTRVETKLVTIASESEKTKSVALPMSPVAWLDSRGNAVKTRVSVAGMLFETYRVADEKAAREGLDPKQAAPDVFAASMIQEDGLLPAPRRLDEATIVVTKRHADATLPNVADAGHEALLQKDGSLLVRAVRLTPPEGKQGTRPLAQPAPELADALAASSMIQSDAPEIVAVVKQVVGAETNAWKAAQALERWVWDSITEKNMSVAFASALEVCKSKEGDCSEHAVLLAALCRASGIPARVVMGVEYIAGIWGGHAWNEVWIGGVWYPLDATNGFGSADPLHLPMARMTMKEGGAAEFVELLGSLGGIDVDVTEVVRDGRRIAVDDPALVTTEKDTWRNRVLGISFRAPEGWELDPPGRKQGIQMRVMELDGKTAAGQTVEIEIDVIDAPAAVDWSKLLGGFGIDAGSAKAATVDGREGRRAVRTHGGREELGVAVVADGQLWIFKLDPAGEAERAAFDAFLASVDFDVK